MKGIVFREFIDFVELSAGEDVVDDMIERANPASGAAYTAVGKYDWREIVDLVSALSAITDLPVPTLVRAFGRHLFGRLRDGYPVFFEDQTDAFNFLETVENRIHVEVLKLYPDAELPTLDVRRAGDNALTINYSSCRPFGDLCLGMIDGCADHFNEPIEMTHSATPNGLMIEVSRVNRKVA